MGPTVLLILTQLPSAATMSPFLSPSTGPALMAKGCMPERHLSFSLTRTHPPEVLSALPELLTPVLSHNLGGFIWNEAQKVALEEEA